MKLYRVTPCEVTAIVATGQIGGRDRRGRPIFEGESSDGRRIEIVLALDVIDFVITVFGEV